MAFFDFVVPGGNTILLTDVNQTVGVLATARSPFGMMLSQGATMMLKEQWFRTDQEMMTVGRLRTEVLVGRPVARAGAIEEFVRLQHPALSLTALPPRGEQMESHRVDRAETLEVSGLAPISVGPGQLRRRRINDMTIAYHEAEKPLELGMVPVIAEPMAIDAAIAELPQEFQLRRATVLAGNKCAGCAACAACAGCVFCAEVNFFVGAVGFVGLAGLVGLAGAVEPPTF